MRPFKLMVEDERVGYCHNCGAQGVLVRPVIAINGLWLSKPEPTCEPCRRSSLVGMETVDTALDAARTPGKEK